MLKIEKFTDVCMTGGMHYNKMFYHLNAGLVLFT